MYGDLLPITLAGKYSSKNVQKMLAKREGAPSCWKIVSWGSWGIQHTAVTYPGTDLQWLSFEKKQGGWETEDSVTHHPTQNIKLRGMPFVSNYDTRMFRSPDVTTVLYTFPWKCKVASSEKQTRVRKFSCEMICACARCVTLLKLTTMDQNFPISSLKWYQPWPIWIHSFEIITNFFIILISGTRYIRLVHNSVAILFRVLVLRQLELIYR